MGKKRKVAPKSSSQSAETPSKKPQPEPQQYEEVEVEEEEEQEQDEDDEPVPDLLKPFGKDQILSLLSDAAAKHREVAERIRRAADEDAVHRSIFVHGLGWDTTAQTLINAFRQYGEIEDCKAVTDNVSGKSKGYDILFKTRRGARNALKQPQKKIGNHITTCQLASIDPVEPASSFSAAAATVFFFEYTQRQVYVCNVSPALDPQKLLTFFSRYGEIEEGPLGLDKVTGRPKGFCLFVYKTVEGANRALEKPQKKFEGHILPCVGGAAQGHQDPAVVMQVQAALLSLQGACMGLTNLLGGLGLTYWSGGLGFTAGLVSSGIPAAQHGIQSEPLQPTAGAVNSRVPAARHGIQSEPLMSTAAAVNSRIPASQHRIQSEPLVSNGRAVTSRIPAAQHSIQSEPLGSTAGAVGSEIPASRHVVQSEPLVSNGRAVSSGIPATGHRIHTEPLGSTAGAVSSGIPASRHSVRREPLVSNGGVVTSRVPAAQHRIQSEPLGSTAGAVSFKIPASRHVVQSEPLVPNGRAVSSGIPAPGHRIQTEPLVSNGGVVTSTVPAAEHRIQTDPLGSTAGPVSSGIPVARHGNQSEPLGSTAGPVNSRIQVTRYVIQSERPRASGWTCPPPSFFKLNVGGNFFHRGDWVGMGGLIRDEEGSWIGGFSGAVGQVSVDYAVLMAIKTGLQLAWDRGLRKLLCHTESVDAVSLLSKELDSDHRYNTLLVEIEELLRRDWVVQLEHTMKEANTCADWLAKLGTMAFDPLTVWDVPPESLRDRYISDSPGVPFPRDVIGRKKMEANSDKAKNKEGSGKPKLK